MAELKDSGERRTFSSGAVRDVAEGKGRCDLLPLDVIARLLPTDGSEEDPILLNINHYVRFGDLDSLLFAVCQFCRIAGFDSMSSAMLELAIHYEDGARKYSERNWEKGIELHCFIDSGVRHYLKFLRGDKDEPHHRAFIWNMLGAVWTHKHKPELIDLPFAEVKPEGI